MTLLLARMDRARRLNILRRVGLLAALLFAGAWFAPTVLEHTAALMHAATEDALPYASLVVSPFGWAVSTLFGLAVLYRAGALRRASYIGPSDLAIPVSYPSAYKYSTNDATAPSNPWTFGLVDSIR
jgi:hypothetical protein